MGNEQRDCPGRAEIAAGQGRPVDTGRRTARADSVIEIAPLYRPADLEQTGFDYARDLGFPGEFPFTRGDRPGIFRTEPFTISAYLGFGETEECNARFRKLLELGIDQIRVALELPTQCGYDSDDEMSVGEVGAVGVALDTLADWEVLFDGIVIEKVARIGTLGNSIGPIVLAMFAALAKGANPFGHCNCFSPVALRSHVEPREARRIANFAC